MESFIPWVGGKRVLRKQILAQFPPDVERYIEVFGGAGWVLFGKEKAKNQLEVFNDANNNLINLFRCVKYHCEALQKELELLPSSRTMFYDYKEQMNSSGLTDIQRAARYFYLIKLSFGGKKDSYATSGKNIENTLSYLRKVQGRLQNVVIENRDFEAIIKIYDRQQALFYLDPPYYMAEHFYDYFSTDDHSRLKNVLEQTKGRFLLSYNDTPFIRTLYSDYNIQKMSRFNYLSSSGNNQSVYQEVLISNY